MTMIMYDMYVGKHEVFLFTVHYFYLKNASHEC